jgi:hypothetical protein
MPELITFPDRSEEHKSDMVSVLEAVLEAVKTGEVTDFVGIALYGEDEMLIFSGNDLEGLDTLMKYTGILTTGARWCSEWSDTEIEVEE